LALHKKDNPAVDASSGNITAAYSKAWPERDGFADMFRVEMNDAGRCPKAI